MVLIANREEELFSQLEDPLMSRLHSCVRIQFDKYHLKELVAILEARARWGTHRGQYRQTGTQIDCR